MFATKPPIALLLFMIVLENAGIGVLTVNYGCPNETWHRLDFRMVLTRGYAKAVTARASNLVFDPLMIERQSPELLLWAFTLQGNELHVIRSVFSYRSHRLNCNA